MFCYQCEQTAKGQGCSKIGVCGKQPEVATLQDLLIHALKGLALCAIEGRKVGINDHDANVFTCEATFSTLTNVDFDAERFVSLINRSVELRERLRDKVAAAGGATDFPDGPATFQPETTLEGLVKQGKAVGLKSDPDMDPDILALQHTLLFGIKGVSAYADHALILGQEDDQVFAFIHEGLAATLNKNLTLDDWVSLVLKCGEINLRTMELLDAGNTATYGHPVPTQVPLGAKKGKAILVSGHDLKDLEAILKQSEGKGINVYTHGEMLKPRDSYNQNIFTTGLVGWPGVTHIAEKDFTPVIQKALAMPGFSEDTNGKQVMCGFGRNAVMGVAETVIGAVKSGALRHFFLVAGCDGAKPGRNYYTEFVEQVPDDCVVLTLACGKFRFFDKDLGDIGGIPRLLDIGQCNDAYSAIQIAVALSKAFDVGVNDLPLSMILSWYEQKAVAILLTLLHLGIKNIRLGPSLPAFITPNVLDVLVKAFNIMPITTPEEEFEGHPRLGSLPDVTTVGLSFTPQTRRPTRKKPKPQRSLRLCGG
jgi:hydroxylamine reductase